MFILKTKDNVEYRLGAKVNKFLLTDDFKMKGIEITNNLGEVEEVLADGAFEYVG